MALPQSIGKSTELRHALTTLRISIHNDCIGDAQNGHESLDAALQFRKLQSAVVNRMNP